MRRTFPIPIPFPLPMLSQQAREPLAPVALITGNATATSRTLIEGESLDYNLLSLIASQISGLSDWSQLSLDSISFVFQNYKTTYTFTIENFDSHVKSGYAYQNTHASHPNVTAAAVYFNDSQEQFYIKEMGSPFGSITRSSFTARTGGSAGDFLSIHANDTDARADTDYDVTRRQYYYNTTTGGFRQHSPNSATFFSVANNVAFTGTFIEQDDADSQSEVLTWIEGNNPNPNTNYAYYDATDGALYDVAYTAPVAAWQTATIAEVTDDLNSVWIPEIYPDDVRDWFADNGYDSTKTYYYYDDDDIIVDAIATVTDAQNWTNMVAGQEYSEVTLSELTRQTGNTINTGRLSISLSDDAVTGDKDDLFRAVVSITSGAATFTCYLPFDIQDADLSLSDLASTGTYTAQAYREGAAETFLDLEDVFGMSAGDWERYDIASVSIDVETSDDSGVTWEDMTASGFQGLLPTEYHLNTTEGLSAHRFGFRVFENVIDDDILYNATNRLRFLVTIEDNDMAEITRYIPFSALSGVDLSTFNHTTVFSAITVREGGAAVDIDLVAGLFQIDSWSDVHWSTVTAALQQSTDSGQNWANQTAEFQGLAVSERTLTTSALLSSGNLSLALGSDSIDTDILHDDTNRMRILVTMSDGTHTRFVAIPVSFRAPMSLSDLDSLLTSAAQEFRQGAAAINLSYTNLFSDITNIDDYNIQTATIKVQKSSDNGQFWEDMDAAGFQGLLPTEYTLTTTSLTTALQWMFRIHENAIQSEILHDGQNRLRFELVITD